MYLCMLSSHVSQFLYLQSECGSINQDSSDFYFPILVSLFELKPQFPVLGRLKCHPVWSSAAVAYLLQGWVCYIFRDSPLQTLVLMSGYLG